MKVKNYISIAVVLLMSGMVASCDDVLVPENPTNELADNAVCIKATVADGTWQELSRSLYLTPFDRLEFKTGDKIGVFGYYLPDGTTLPTDTTPDFMNNQEMTYDGAKWSYSPVKYWPNNNNDKLAFWAYYPYGMSNTTVRYNLETRQPELSISKQPYANDIMVADMVTSGKISANGGVPLVFRHILAKVNLVLAFNEFLDEDIPDPTLKLRRIMHRNIYTSGDFKGFVDGVAQWENCGDVMNWYDDATYELKPGDRVFVDQDYTFFIPFYLDEISFIPLIIAGEGGTANNRYNDDNGLGTYTEENFAKETEYDEFNFYLSNRGFGENGVYMAPGTETTIIINLGLYGVDNVEVTQRPIAEWIGDYSSSVTY